MYWDWRLDFPVQLFFYMCGLNSAMTAFIRMPTEPTGGSPTLPICNRNASRIQHTSAPIARTIQASFPEVQSVTRVRVPADVLVVKGNIKFQEENALWADSSFFSIFDFLLKFGDPKTALIGPIVVFSETAARKYFGNTNPVGHSASFRF